MVSNSWLVSIPRAHRGWTFRGCERALLQLAYIAYYGRAADPAGLDYWLGVLDSGTDIDSVRALMATDATEEFVQLYGENVDPATFFERAYVNVLNRLPDPQGQSFWVAQLRELERRNREERGLAPEEASARARADVLNALILAALETGDASAVYNKLRLALQITERVAGLDNQAGALQAASALLATPDLGDTTVYEQLLAQVDALLQAGGDAEALVRRSFTIPAPADYYGYACDAPVIQFVLPVTLNDDSYRDFIIHYWCSLPGDWGRFADTPTPDALVALVSSGEGVYTVANDQVFGTPFPGLGGASRKVVRRDLNGDGQDDFLFAMNREDGRSGEVPSTNATGPSILLSTGDDRYEVVRLEPANWGHAAGAVRYPDGAQDALFAGFHGGFHAYRFAEGTFSPSQQAYPARAFEWASAFIDIPGPEGTAYLLGTESRTDPATGTREVGAVLYERTAGGWEATDDFWLPVDFRVEYISWQETLGLVDVLTIDGEQYLGGAFDAFCRMPPLVEGGPALVVGKLASAQLAAGGIISPGARLDQDDFQNINTFVFFEIRDGALVQVPSPLVDEERAVTGNFFDCADLNGDGAADLAYYAFTRPGFGERVEAAGKPIVYLNDGSGQLQRRDLSALPGHTAGNELQSRLVDVDGDGVLDLMLFGSAADNGGGNIEVHLLARGL